MFGNFRSGRAARRMKTAGGGRRSGPGDRLATGRSRTAVFELLEQRAMLTTTYSPLPGTADGATGSLRADVALANADTGSLPDLIMLSAGEYDLTSASGELNLTNTSKTVIIDGAGIGATIINQKDLDRVFNIASGATVIFENLEITGGTIGNALGTDAQGGGILSQGTLTLDSVSVTDNVAKATVAPESPMVVGGNALGGGIASFGALTIENGSMIDGNQAVGANGSAGYFGGDGDGGGVYSGTAEQVEISDTTISGNIARAGGGGDGVGGDGGQAGEGAGGGVLIENSGTSSVVLNDDTVAGNTSACGNGGNGAAGFDGGGSGPGEGGGIEVFDAATVMISNTTVSGNMATSGNGGTKGSGTTTSGGEGGYGFGGGIETDVTGTKLVDDTIYGNTATGGGGQFSGNAEGGGISDFTAGLTIVNCTIASNSAVVVAPVSGGTPGTPEGGGICNLLTPDSSLDLYNTLVAGNTAAGSPDVFGPVATTENNLIGDDTGSMGFNTTSPQNDQFGTSGAVLDAKLGPLQNNGGNTETVALLAGSPALGKGDVGAAISAGLMTDQRGAGFARVENNTVDVGALETQLQMPIVTDATTIENTQTTSGLVILPGPNDATAADFQITGITGGDLFQNDGTTPIANGDFITLAQGAAGLKFNPISGSLAGGSFVVQESTSNVVAELGGTTAQATITVTLAGPSVTDATTSENTQTTSGLVIPLAPDDSSVAYFQITGITGGTLFQHDGTTAIANGDFISLGQGEAGLKFTPTTGSVAGGSFTVQESTSNVVSGLSGSTATAAIHLALAGPSVTDAATTENRQTAAGLVITPAAGDTTTADFQITGISGGTLFQNDGTTAIANGAFITVAQGAAGLKFTPTSGSLAGGSFVVQESTSNAMGGLGGPTAAATIAVTLAGPSVTDAPTTEGTQSTSGLVITPGASDSSAAFFQITGITGGTLFQNDGTTAIASGAFITAAQGAAGLKFTPTGGSLTSGTFNVQESTSGVVGGLSGPTATATIDVGLTGPSVSNATTLENTQTTSGLVITPGAGDSAAAFLQITAITGGSLFQNNGTTAIGSGSFITVAQGVAGLKFTPTNGSLAGGSFVVQESTSSGVSGLSGPTATATIAVSAQSNETVDLSSDYNLTGIATDGSHFGGGLDGQGNALAASRVGSSISWNGLAFPIAGPNVDDVVQAVGQTIAVPSGNYSSLALLATGTNGNQDSQTFTVHYTDGSSTPITQSISDWAVGTAGSTLSGNAGQSVALSTAYRNTSTGGTDTSRGPFNVFGYSLTLDPTKTIDSITLPDNSHVKILAMIAMA
jgi:hypothetical protein